ncbi:hypothetical protein NL676_033769 [Syzygium grande]|nr:hypothetical protein NL676_033769 [Syzygium grande]
MPLAASLLPLFLHAARHFAASLSSTLSTLIASLPRSQRGSPQHRSPLFPTRDATHVFAARLSSPLATPLATSPLASLP